NSNYSACSSQRHSFKKKLPGDIAAPRADGLAHADFARSLGDRNQHDVHYAHAADQKTDRAKHYHSENDAADDVVELPDHFYLRLNRKIVRSAVGNVAPAAQNFAQLVHCGIELARISEKSVPDFVAGWIQLHESVIGDPRPPVFVVGAKPAQGLFKPAHNQISGPVHENLFSERIIYCREKCLGDVFADDYNIFTVLVFGFREKAARFHRGV